MTEQAQQTTDFIAEGRVLRPELRSTEITVRGRSLPEAERARIRNALRALHTLEIMAVTIYRRQITNGDDPVNRELIAAMGNEMTHVQDFQIKLYEYGMRPSPVRWAYWIVGFILGTASRWMGTRAILKTGIWVETKAVHHYAELLGAADWDEATRRILEKDQADEDGHIQNWKKMLDAMQMS